MKIIIISILVLLGSVAHTEDYSDNFIGSCDVKNTQLTANFYIRSTDKQFRFEYIDESGEVAEDTSVEHRQNILTKKHGIQAKRTHIQIKATDSFYKAKFKYYQDKGTANFRHKKSCIREWFFEPCELYVEKYRVNFENCSLDFSGYID